MPSATTLMDRLRASVTTVRTISRLSISLIKPQTKDRSIFEVDDEKRWPSGEGPFRRYLTRVVSACGRLRRRA